MRVPVRQRGGGRGGARPPEDDESDPRRDRPDDKQAAEALCQSIEHDHGGMVAHGDAQMLVRALGGNPNLGNMSPGAVALYLIALLLAART